MKKGNSFDEPAKIIKRDNAPERTVYALTFSEALTNFFRNRFSKERFAGFLRESFPQKGDSTSEKVRKIIMDISFVLLILGISYMIFYYAGYRERIKDLGDWEVSIEKINEDELFDFEVKKLWSNIKEQYPDIDFPEGMALKFANLYAINQDVIGVMRIPEIDFFTPVMQKKSAPTFYQWKDLYGQYSRYGTPYVDARCEVGNGELSKNTIIYGHNTHDKLGFNKLTEYMKIAGYKKAPVITIETLYEKTQWKIFGVILTNSTSDADRGYLFPYLITSFSSDEEFNEMIDGISERSMIRTGVDVNSEDKILTLYTCYQDIFEGGRLVVFARLVRDGESADVDVSKAYFNDAARYPQAYYDKLELTNPYEKLTEGDVTTTDSGGSVGENVTDTPFGDDIPAENVPSEGASDTEVVAPSVPPEETTAADPVVQEETTAAEAVVQPEEAVTDAAVIPSEEAAA